MALLTTSVVRIGLAYNYYKYSALSQGEMIKWMFLQISLMPRQQIALKEERLYLVIKNNVYAAVRDLDLPKRKPVFE